MWIIVLSTFTIIALLLQTVFLFPFLVIFALSVAFVEKPKISAIFAFVVGLVIDISLGRLMGATSLYLLIACLIIQMYRKKFTEDSVVFLGVFVFIAIHIYNYIFKGAFSFYIIEGVISALVVFAVSYLLYVLKNSASHE